MLDSIRSNAQSWGVKIAFGIIILVFVFWGVGSMQEGPSSILVTVNGKPILYQEYRSALKLRLDSLRTQFPTLTEDDVTRLGLKQQVLRDMISETLLAQAAADAGISVTPLELRRAIEAIPVFNDENGKFNAERYIFVLKQQGTNPGQFESQMQGALLEQKLRDSVTSGAFIADDEIRALFNFGNEQRQLAYLLLPMSDHLDEIQLSDADIKTYYDGNAQRFAVPAKAKVDYVHISPARLAGNMKVDDAAVAAFYKKNPDRFQQPEKVHVRHLLFRVPKDAAAAADAAAKAKAEDAVRSLKAGTDFATLAKKVSEDPTTRETGDLGWVQRGETVPPFEATAFALKKGELSAPVRTDFGYHVIRLDEREAARQLTLEEARPRIAAQLAQDQASEKLQDTLDSMVELIILGTPLAEAAKQQNVNIESSDLLNKEELQARLGIKPQAVDQIMAAAKGSTIENPLETADGFVLVTVTESNPASTRPLEEVKTDIVGTLKAQKAREIAFVEAEKLRATLKDELPAALQKQLRTSPVFARDNAPADLSNAKLVAEAFLAPLGKWMPQVYAVPQGAVIVRPMESVLPTEETWKTAEPKLRASMIQSRKDELFRIFVGALSNKAKVEQGNLSLLEQ